VRFTALSEMQVVNT